MMKCKSSVTLALACSMACAGNSLFAVPPLVTDDVPTAEKQTFELFTGFSYESDDHSFRRALPAVELTYGITDQLEIGIAASYLSLDGVNGFGDLLLGTKYNFIRETKKSPGVAITLELSVPTARRTSDLGTGTFDSKFVLCAQKSWGWFTGLVNAGYSILPDSTSNGQPVHIKNVFFLGFAQEYQVASKTKLFSEIYFETGDEPGEPNRLAAGVGLEQNLTEKLKFQASIGKSLREGNRGGPEVLLYLGFEWDFDAPWKRPEAK